MPRTHELESLSRIAMLDAELRFELCPRDRQVAELLLRAFDHARGSSRPGRRGLTSIRAITVTSPRRSQASVSAKLRRLTLLRPGRDEHHPADQVVHKQEHYPLRAHAVQRLTLQL
jgi:hypothetical protein